MNQKNLNLRYDRVLTTYLSPGLAVGTTLHPLAAVQALGNTIAPSLQNLNSAAAVSSWPDPVNVYNLQAIQTQTVLPYLSIFKTTPGSTAIALQRLNISTATVTVGFSVKRKDLGFAVYGVDLTQLFTGAADASIFQLGLDIGSGASRSPFPTRSIVNVNGALGQSFNQSNSNTHGVQYPYIQQSEFAFPQRGLSSATQVAPMILVPYPAVSTLTDATAGFNDWYDGGLNPYFYQVDVCCRLDISLGLDPSYITNDQNNNSDLYIILPSGLNGGLSAQPNAGQPGPTHGFMNNDPTQPVGGVNNFGAIGATITPLQRIKDMPHDVYNTLPGLSLADVDPILIDYAKVMLADSSIPAHHSRAVYSSEWQASLEAIPDAGLPVNNPLPLPTGPDIGPFL